MSSLRWTGCPVCRGMGVQFGAENAAQLLELTGYEVMLAYDGATALARAAQFQPQIVLLDIGLPDMDGYAVAQALRAMDGFASVTLMALTGWGSEQDRLRSSEAGFDLHLTKPVDFAALQKVLAQVSADANSSSQ